MNMLHDILYGTTADTAIYDDLPYTKPNRKARRRSDALHRGLVSKHTPYGRIHSAKFDEAGNRIAIRHTTRGTKSRVLTDQLMNALAA